ncbi:MAG: GAF domain-containing protein [Cytophagales bacterium]|nr:GAF domain-containing protein [Bernardetiaceae bacterium]MDW8209501.1 GAF domain-containing protein [Cytophagales bacterium]
MQKQYANRFSVRGLTDFSAIVFGLSIVLCYAFTNNSQTIKDEILFGLLLVIALIAYLIIVYGLINPMIKIANVMADIIDGDYQAKVPFYNNRLFIRFHFLISLLRDNLQAAYALVEAMAQKAQIDPHASYLLFLRSQSNPLADALRRLYEKDIEFAARERERLWETQGVAKFVEILRTSNQSIEELSNAIITNLVRYLQAQQGAIYVVATDEAGVDFLRLTGLYAHDRELLGTTCAIGEGLVGQCFESQKTILINEIAETKLLIRSGLGEAPPRALLIVPAIINNDAFAVIEIASFSPFQPYQVAFVERLAESIAATIANSIAAMRNRKLVEELNTQTEQMRAQEELMRQTIEQAFQTQAELEQKIAEINRIKEEERKRIEVFRQTQQKILQRLLEKHKQQLAQKDAEIAALKKQIEQYKAGV